MGAEPSGRPHYITGGSSASDHVARYWRNVPTAGTRTGSSSVRLRHDKSVCNTQAAIEGLRHEPEAKFDKDRAELQQKQVETQGKIDEIATNI